MSFKDTEVTWLCIYGDYNDDTKVIAYVGDRPVALLASNDKKAIAEFMARFANAKAVRTKKTLSPIPVIPPEVEPKPEPKPETKPTLLEWYPKAIKHECSMKQRGKYPTKSGFPTGLVVHYSAGRDDAKATNAWGASQGFAFLAMNSEGVIVQSIPLNQWGYHAGNSKHGSLNGVSEWYAGIEMCNAGMVDEVVVKGEKRYKAWFHKSESEYFRANEVRYVEKKNGYTASGFFHKYTPEQEESLIKFCLFMKTNCPEFSFDNVVGHDEVATPLGRKQDPGGALSMTMPQLRAELKKRWEALKS